MTFQRVKKIMAELFNVDSEIIFPNTVADDIDGWDSMSNIKLIILVEKEFNIRLTGMEASGLENVDKLVKLINSKLD